MSNSILYYPTIEFRHEDYQWLWNAALFADKIYRIVPPGYELNEPRNIRELCSTGEIGIPLSPVPYSKEASEEFSKFMDENHRKAAALAFASRSSRSSSSRSYWSRISSNAFWALRALVPSTGSRMGTHLHLRRPLTFR